ncbi:hypothetical protein LZZ85_03750 [Terrimonas sp. NA20]|uniref:Alpha-L-rhamnosidase six-hairpin glycosidase domain-containing protein n=1 Tax=Terrimonas ginsenosidimutans TaxID=2908004 RepID=A0ABS9KM29_9BACT|nr:hypothetical protein [Terrimonas ginsenosidimutans]MCG2613375.1 hypothetical protein [Terrimonas ginsenosidimutans]
MKYSVLSKGKRENIIKGISCWIILTIFSVNGGAQMIRNSYYTVSISAGGQKDFSFNITHKASGISRKIVPQLQLVFTTDHPALRGVAMDGQPGVVAWNTSKGLIQDIGELGSTTLKATAVQQKNNELLFSFGKQPEGEVSLTVKFDPSQQAPLFEMGLTAARQGHYSIGFTGMPSVDSSALDFVYQPLTWSWKRFPSRFGLTEEAYANTAAVFTNHHGYSEGLAVSIDDIPYRYALAAQWNNAGKADNKFWSVFPADGPKGNSLFGMAIRNPQGKAQATVFSPLPGTEKSMMRPGDHYKLSLVYLLYPGNWEQGTSFLLSSIFRYRNERENNKVSLNGTLDNMLDFAMNDVYSGWNKELKASDYQFDVPGTVKNVSALHPLSIAMITGSDEIMQRRALPMIEYVMSREKFLYSTSDSAHQAQVPSHLLNGPCVDIGELVGLNELTKGQTPAFSIEADRLFGKSRQLNMNTETGGGSWQDYLARYRMYKRKDDLRKAIDGANDYLKQVYQRYSSTFFDSPGLRDKGAGFTTDYGYRIYDLYELYQETNNETFLKAALTGAKQLLLWTRSNPSPPPGNITINKDGEVKGIFPGRRVSAIEGSPFAPMNETSYVPEMTVPAWQTSLNGLVPEAPNTYAFGPVMLAHHAAWLLRLAYHSNDTLLRNAAYNAIVGRYANFPGYYFTSLHTDVYQRFDYPLHPFHDVKYNAIFYNHLWPHLTLLMDFLVSDFFFRSKGKINFPATYAPGYAFLTSNVYGAKKGSMMGNDSIQLWMPTHALQSDGTAFNHIMGHSDKDIFIAFTNTAKKITTEKIRLNRDVIGWSAGRPYSIIEYKENGTSRKAILKNGELSITLPAGGFTCIRIKDIYQERKDVKQTQRITGSNSNRFVRIKANEDSTAATTAMIIQPTDRLAKFYAYCNKTEKEWTKCNLRYRLNDSKEWLTIEDNTYPFEFDLILPAVKDKISFEINAVRTDGSRISFPVQTIND